MSIKSKISKAIARRRPPSTDIERSISEVFAHPDVQRALETAVGERVESIMRRALRPLQRTGAGVLGEVPLDDLEYDDDYDRLAGQFVSCSICKRDREANCLADIDVRRASGRPSSAYCWCGFGPAVPEWS